MGDPKRRPLGRRMQGQLEAARGFLFGDLGGQLEKAKTLLRHREAYARLDQAVLHFRLLYAVLLCHRLGLLRHLAEGALFPAEAAARCGIDERAASQLLRVLEADELVEVCGDRYALTDFAREFLVSDGPLSYAPLLELMASYTGSFEALMEGMRSGQRAPRMEVLEDEAGADAFLDAVNRYLDNAGRELLSKVRLPPVRRFITGSMGVSFSALVLREHPLSEVTYGCLPHLVRRIPRLRARYRVDPGRVTGMHDHSGSPAGDRWGEEDFDLVFLTRKMVLDPDGRLGEEFARKALEVLRPGGVAIFWEAVHEDGGPTPLARALESMLDLGISPRGCVWTRAGLTARLRELGFVSSEVVECLAGETTFVVARKGA